LFFVGPKSLMAVAFTTTPTFTPGAVSPLFDITGYTFASLTNNNRRYAVGPDGQRFLFLKAAATGTADDTSQRLMFVVNWFEELKQQVPR
jgi:hypothetical protein